MYAKYKEKGLRILGFPCNQFMGQEPLCSVDLKEYAKKNGIEWDMFDKIDVNGNNTIPLYNYLKSKQGGFILNAIKWNFTTFLVNKEGIPVARHGPTTDLGPFDKEVSALL